MSRTNPSTRTCMYCDQPPAGDWTEAQLCTEHKARAAARAEGNRCTCGHTADEHIYGDGACRPGSICGCPAFTQAAEIPADPAACATGQALQAAALIAEASASAGIEFNFPAVVIQTADAALNPFIDGTLEQQRARLRRALEHATLAAEAGMLQLAFLNEDCNPGSPFITAAAAAGWRYRIDKGFHRAEVAA